MTSFRSMLNGRFLRRLAGAVGRRKRRDHVEIAPDIRSVYAVGDVHGQLDALQRIESWILDDAAARHGRSCLVMLGDYIDRGPESRRVIDHVIGASFRLPRLCLCGNHEEMMLDFIARPTAKHAWLKRGGAQTLGSYGIDILHMLGARQARPETIRGILREAIPRTHVEFLRQLPSAASTSDVIFAHAGIRPGVPLDQQEDSDLLWIREPFLERGPELDHRIVVHGHTITREVVQRKRRIGIDTGAARGRQLSVVRVADDGIFQMAVEVSV